MNDCALTGTIPEQIANLSNLGRSRLCLADLLPDILLISSCLILHSESLGLHNNGLEGNIPSGLTELTDLALLYLDNNKLTGNIPDSMGNLSNLSKSGDDLYLAIFFFLTFNYSLRP
jgi:hypothetical protein